ncbi:MAG: response regulator, partial [Candidatus Omnitrophica bacterium]|nr:response regulator [Candidatus Omnitrophota bacterium]
MVDENQKINELYSQVKANEGRVKEVVDLAKEAVPLSAAIRQAVLALQKVSAGDPNVQLDEESNIKLISQLYHAVNNASSDIGRIVEISHEFAIDISEHFEILKKATQGNLQARASTASKQELAAALGNCINKLIQTVSFQIAERKLAEGVARQKEEETNVILHGAGDAIRVINSDFTVIKANDAMEKMISIPLSQMVGKKCYETFPGEQCHTDNCPLKKVLADKKKLQYETTKKDIFEIEIPVEVIITPYLIKGNVQGIIESYRDISEWKRIMDNLKKTKQTLEDQANALQATLRISESLREDLDEERQKAEESARAKADFLANMSHEIRTPMNAILGFSDILRKSGLNDKQSMYVKSISSSGELLIGIINDILDFSKLESGKIAFEQVTFNLRSLIDGIFKMVITRMSNKPFDTYIDADDDVPLDLVGDPTRLKQILVNLLGNAIKFTQQGSIGVLVKKEPGGSDEHPLLRFIVKDTGIGISKDKLELIFDAFTQADTSTTRKYGGTGLGLAICRHIVDAMGGKIWVESETGKGSEFIFILPFNKAEAMPEAMISDYAEGQIKGKRVLIVDDNAIAQKIHSHCCQKLGMNIVSVEDSGYSALDRLQKLKDLKELPDLILCDIIMEGMNGYELVGKIKEDPALKSVKIIALTADLKIAEGNTVEERGFDGYLIKPVTLETLARTIESLYAKSKDDKESAEQEAALDLICQGIRVLVVEDTFTNQMLMKVFFEELGCCGDFVNNGKEAVDWYKSHKGEYDLILMDLQMPEMGGAEATRIIRKDLDLAVPIVALTAAVLEEDRKEAADSGMNDFLAKPVNMENL